MNKTITHDEVKALSHSFISGLDRSVLGHFAVDENLLTYLDTNERRVGLHLDGYHVGNRSEYAVDDEMEGHLKIMGDDTLLIIGELLWWWSTTDEPLWEYKNAVARLKYKAVMERVDTIARHQDKHPYFSVDIWDIDFIERCLADDIDPIVAKSLVLNNG